MSKSRIPWTDYVWNPVTGCDAVSSGCLNCYAKKIAEKMAGKNGYDRKYPFKITEREDRLDEPFKWKRSQRIFVCSMGDLYHTGIRTEYLDKIIHIIGQCSHHTFLILTKRPHIAAIRTPILHENVYFGITAENQEMLRLRYAESLRIDTHHRFVSFEPLLSSIDLFSVPHTSLLDFVIVGGENGKSARRMNFEWVSKLYEQCDKMGINFFFKGWGSNFKPGKNDIEFMDEIEEGCSLDSVFKEVI